MPCSCAGFRARILRVIGEGRTTPERSPPAPGRPFPGPISRVRDPWCPRHGDACSMSVPQAVSFYLDCYEDLVGRMFGP